MTSKRELTLRIEEIEERVAGLERSVAGLEPTTTISVPSTWWPLCNCGDKLCAHGLTSVTYTGKM